MLGLALMIPMLLVRNTKKFPLRTAFCLCVCNVCASDFEICECPSPSL